jgi:MFS family permease
MGRAGCLRCDRRELRGGVPSADPVRTGSGCAVLAIRDLTRPRHWRPAPGGETAATRKRTIVMLAAVLALDSADLGTIGAVAVSLERSLHIGDLQLGVLASVVSLTAAVATLPVGWLTDRVARVPLLAGSILIWSSATVISGAAASFTMLLVTRLALGAVQATSGPTLASLTGDLFRARERSRIFGYIHAGELAGGAFGFLVSGEVAAVLGWRWSFWLLSVPGFVLAVALWRWLPEPQRGGASRLRDRRHDADERELVHRLVAEQGVKPAAGTVLSSDPAGATAIRRLLGIRTNLLLIGAFALGYFFLGGARTFGVIFFRGHYHLGQAAATAASASLGVGALVGVILGGRLADRWLAAGRLNARVVVAAAGYLTAAIVFAAPVAMTAVWLAVPLYILAAAALVAPSAPLDAAILDVIPGPLWGRGEGLQTALRTLAMAVAPVLFGFLADVFGHTRGHSFGQGTYGSHPAGGAQGLEVTFLLMLSALALAGALLVRAAMTYGRDAAGALESESRMAGSRTAGSAPAGEPAGAPAARGRRRRRG